MVVIATFLLPESIKKYLIDYIVDIVYLKTAHVQLFRWFASSAKGVS